MPSTQLQPAAGDSGGSSSGSSRSWGLEPADAVANTQVAFDAALDAASAAPSLADALGCVGDEDAEAVSSRLRMLVSEAVYQHITSTELRDCHGRRAAGPARRIALGMRRFEIERRSISYEVCQVCLEGSCAKCGGCLTQDS